ncbi:MAG: NUDIX domain-containing protein [Ginsengibacter sp.]
MKIFFGDKPVFLCDEINEEIHEYMHHPDVIFIDETSAPAIHTLIHEIAKAEFNAGILWHKSFQKLKNAFYKHFSLVQAGGGLITNPKNEVLMIFRRGKWDLPKGKLDTNETIEDCALREVREETGLSNLILGTHVTTTYHTYAEFGKHILKESHWFFMESTGMENPVPQTEEDITDIRWISQDELKKYVSQTFPAIQEVLSALNKT